MMNITEQVYYYVLIKMKIKSAKYVVKQFL